MSQVQSVSSEEPVDMQELQDIPSRDRGGPENNQISGSSAANSSASEQHMIVSIAPIHPSNIPSGPTNQWRKVLQSPELIGIVSLTTLALTIIAVAMAICSTLWASKSFTFGACVSLAQIDRFTRSCNDTIAGGIPAFGIRQRSADIDFENDNFEWSWSRDHGYSRQQFLKTSSLREFVSVTLLLVRGFIALALSCFLDPLPPGSRFSSRYLWSEGSLLLRTLGMFAALFWCEIAFYGLYPKDTVAFVEIVTVLVIVGIGSVLSVRWRRLGLRKLKEG
ncbi:hypothetical protein M409DRAFT_24352 [Zasmidium cellare ATCC 36951]|uniref:Uncharacterized protein n=1 Tax=Zasmidium cellare ATCC 36951 TaxID=1080233 RepID=A0A6A6CH41_ZASCE|nr:uncharacterized protein M409DRAFT_24352 [Zasmidium cellare ATCC 36951]KAF2165500.1 hypothetical protein M409DRAFT_24352 [Zasmidium cellare ATCC 36951]